MKKILFILGTRPEGIKLAPLYLRMKEQKHLFDIRLCSTGQHKDMLDQVFKFFKITPDYSFDVMVKNQTLSELTKNILGKLDKVFDDFEPEMVLVQGDTTTVLAGALGAFYRGIKIGHIEAGLRTFDIHNPFPEEANRVLVSRLADVHFAPTNQAKQNLIKEGVSLDKIFMTGNTVTDAIVYASDLVKDSKKISSKFKNVNFKENKVILLTAHRRENLGEGLHDICSAVASVARSRQDVEFVFPVHLNPKVQMVANSILGDLDNVHLCSPLDYSEMVWMIYHCYFVLTDSGGIQEEAPTLGKPVLVMRQSTERPEGVEAGTALLVGTRQDLIKESVISLLDNTNGIYESMARAVNPYGDGRVSERVAQILHDE